MGYDDSDERQQQLDAEYSRLVSEYNYQVSLHNSLVVDAESCAQDVSRSINMVNKLHRAVMPHMTTTADRTEKEQVIAYNASMVIDDLVDSYVLLKNESTASKNLTDSREKYYTLFGLYNELRSVALGYVVGLDKNFWTSDVPRKKVEKMYLSNTEYWLAYTTMAVMLWASDEQDACARAVSKAMQINERKSSLFFLLAALRFNRPAAAKRWYEVYFSLVESGGIGEEIIYILQALLIGALGSDREFYERVDKRMNELVIDSKTDLNMKRDAQQAVDSYFEAFISVTEKEFLSLKHICPEYAELMELLSKAEKNGKLKEYFKSVISSHSELSDRLSERIEDSLYSLISSNDDSEQELLDTIDYQEMIVKANGRLDVADKAFESFLREKRKEHNLALILVNTAFDVNSKAHTSVKKYAFGFVRDYCLLSAEKFVSYRTREKPEYDLEVDGCPLHGDENSFEANKPKLLSYYDGLIKEKIRGDKAINTLKKATVAFGAIAALFAVLFVLGITLDWGVATKIVPVIFVVLFGAAIGLTCYLMHDRKGKIRSGFAYRIENGIKMLGDGLNDLASWRAAYHSADAEYNELIKVLKEEVNNG